MIDEVLSTLARVRLDDLVGYALAGLAVLIVVAFPKQFRQSLLRWGGDERRAGPSVRAPAGPVLAQMKRLVRPTLLLIPAPELGFSKLGGDPELPADVTWPIGFGGPRTFLAQIDLGAAALVSRIPWLPSAGRLFAFCDSELHDAADVVCVRYSREPPGPPVPKPAKARGRFPERRVGFIPKTSAPNLDWLGLDASTIDLSETGPDDFESIGTAPPADEIQHRIGGYPNEIQPARMWLVCEHLARGLPDPDWNEEIPPAIERAAKEWRLLMQIDSDPALKMNFGDGGRLYVFIRERHARRGDFSKTVALWQTY